MNKKDSISRKIFYVCNCAFMVALMVVCVVPYLHVMAKSFNEGFDTSRGGILIWPRVWTLDNYKAVLTDSSIVRAFFVTVSIVLLNTSLHVLMNFVVAYVFLNRHFVGRNFLLIMFIIPMYFGGGLIPTYILYSNLGLLNNYWVYIIPGLFSTYNMVVMRSYLRSIPESLRESAKVDGASELTIAFRIIFPLAKPVLATVALWTAVGNWNSWTTTMYFIRNHKLDTLQYLLMEVLKEAERMKKMMQEMAERGMLTEDVAKKASRVTTESIQCAQIIITTVPILVAYPFLQKYFIQGMTLGSVKD